MLVSTQELPDDAVHCELQFSTRLGSLFEERWWEEEDLTWRQKAQPSEAACPPGVHPGGCAVVEESVWECFDRFFLEHCQGKSARFLTPDQVCYSQRRFCGWILMWAREQDKGLLGRWSFTCKRQFLFSPKMVFSIIQPLLTFSEVLGTW